jgi:type I restriction enzyme S subunit
MRKQQLIELDNLIKSVFYDMFGDPTINEKGWPLSRIGDLTTVETGSTPNRNILEYYQNGQISWVKTGEIIKGYIDKTEEKITQKAIRDTNCKVFPINTILVAMYGQGKTRGQAGILKIEAATNQASAAILPNKLYVSEFLYQLLVIMYEELRGLGRGGNQPNLNLSMVKDFSVILPPLDYQTQFATIVTKIEAQKSLVKKSIEETQLLFDSLMSQYFDE